MKIYFELFSIFCIEIKKTNFMFLSKFYKAIMQKNIFFMPLEPIYLKTILQSDNGNTLVSPKPYIFYNSTFIGHT